MPSAEDIFPQSWLRMTAPMSHLKPSQTMRSRWSLPLPLHQVTIPVDMVTECLPTEDVEEKRLTHPKCQQAWRPEQVKKYAPPLIFTILSLCLFFFLLAPTPAVAHEQINIPSWNCCGTGQDSFLPDLRRKHLPSVLFLCETRSKTPNLPPKSNKFLVPSIPSMFSAWANLQASC